MDYRATAGAGAAIVTSWVRSLVKMKWLHYTGGGATRMKPLKCREFPTFFRGVTRQQVIFKTFLTLCHASIICLLINDALTRKRESWRRCTALLLTHSPPSPTPHLSIPLSHIHYQLPPSPFILHSPRVDSFVFFFCFAKYDTVRNRSLFRQDSIVLRNCKISENTKKSVSSCFAKLQNNVSFRIFIYFLSNFVPSLWVSYLVFEFRTSSRVLYLLFEFRTYYSSCVPFCRHKCPVSSLKD